MKVNIGPESDDHESACESNGHADTCIEKLHEWLHDAEAQAEGPEVGIALVDSAIAHLAFVRSEISLSAMQCAKEVRVKRETLN